MSKKLWKVRSQIRLIYPEIADADIEINKIPNSKGNLVGFELNFILKFHSSELKKLKIQFNRSLDQVTSESIFRKFRIYYENI